MICLNFTKFRFTVSICFCSVKPKYATDPTPNLFLAKGMLGLAKGLEFTPKIDRETAMSECVASYVAAKELDLNGVLFDD